MTLIAGNRRFKLGHVNIARKGPVNCRILKASVKIPGPVSHKIWNLSKIPGPVNRKSRNTSKIPDPQSQIVHVDKLKLVHVEPGLEDFHAPENEDLPVVPTDLDGVRPRRITRKPRHLTDDYVFNLFSASSSRNQLFCHLCGHPPFSSRRLWKGHLYMIHGVSSALAMSGPSSTTSHSDPEPVSDMSMIVSPPPMEIPATDNDAPMATSSAYEDISDEDTSAGGVATVCRISSQESNSDVLKGDEKIVEADETLILDDELKSREMNIIWTLLAKIKEKNQTFLTASLVREMKELFPELSSERVFALFMWTVWMHERSSKSRSDENSRVSCSGGT